MTTNFRLERLDHLAAKFKLKCDIHEAWSRGKEDMLQAQDFKKCRLSDLKVMMILDLNSSHIRDAHSHTLPTIAAFLRRCSAATSSQLSSNSLTKSVTVLHFLHACLGLPCPLKFFPTDLRACIGILSSFIRVKWPNNRVFCFSVWSPTWAES